jgi:large subunit ribosomal protein L6
MSRIGRLPLPLPKGVTVLVSGATTLVTGPKGKLTVPVPDGITLEQAEGTVHLARRDDSRQQRALHGLTRALLANAVTGTTKGFQKGLEIQGVGYRAELRKDKVEFALGYSHPVVFPIPAGISVEVEKQVRLMVSGIDKQLVGQVAANIRGLRPPEPYKGKGIRYAGEVVVKKAGKAGATAAK